LANPFWGKIRTILINPLMNDWLECIDNWSIIRAREFKFVHVKSLGDCMAHSRGLNLYIVIYTCRKGFNKIFTRTAAPNRKIGAFLGPRDLSLYIYTTGLNALIFGM